MPLARHILLLCVLLALPAAAQSPRLDDSLPPTTQFYLYWHGQAALEPVRGSNSLLRLWNDTEFVSAREALLADMMRTPPGGTPGFLTREMAFTLLESPILVGSVSFPSMVPAPAASSAAAKNKAVQPEGFFLIYDATGKLALVQAAMQGTASPTAQVKALTAGTLAYESVTEKSRVTEKDKTEEGEKTYYRALNGNYYVQADRRDVLEDLLKRLAPGAAKPPSSLGQSLEFQKARRVMGERSALDIFFRFRGMVQEITSQAKDPTGSAITRSLRLEQLHCFAAGITFDAQATRMTGAILGDTAPGGLFDLASASTTSFATLGLVPSNAHSYGVNRFDFVALYNIAQRAFASASTDTSMLDAVEQGMEKQLGMSLLDALKLFTGEFGWFATENSVDFETNYYAVGIRKQADVVYLLRLILGSNITNESQEGSATFFSLTSSFADRKTGAARKRFYYMAVTPTMVLVAPRKALLREVIARTDAKPDSSGASAVSGALLAADVKFQAARARLPQQLSGFSYMDFQRYPWEAMIRVLEESGAAATAGQSSSSAGKSATAAQSADGKAAASSPALRLDWRRFMNPAMLRRHLRAGASGWWKDAEGLYFDGYIE